MNVSVGGAGNARRGAAISAIGLRKEFVVGRTRIVALDGVDLEVAGGESLAVVGQSGSGKSTLLHMIAAMDRPTSGSLQVAEHQVHALRGVEAARYRRTVGFVFQTFNLLGSLTALDNVLAPLVPLGQARRNQHHARELLERVGLGRRADALPGELSGGERQRVAVARALINAPALLIADEPTGNLDSANGGAVLELLLSLHRERGTTLLVATHNPAVSDALGRIVRLADGRILDGA
jgi:putative ABC transport system ATP-binding protein